MVQRLLLIALCAVIAVQLISSVEGARKGCIARCNNGCRNKHASKQKMLQCLMGCAIYPKNCLKCKKGDSKCYGCLPGYGLSMGTCIPCPLGCRCVEPNKCQSCLPGYIIISGVCKACPAVCDSCDSTTGKCTCKSGYVATESPTSPCAACATNCGVCNRNGPGNCDTCKPGFLQVPVNGICTACAANCQVCDVAGAGSCDTCNDGYKLTTSSSSSTVTCNACPTNCKICDYGGTSYCDTCMTGYGLSSDHRSCVVCAQNCLSCNVNGYNKCDGAQCGSATTGYDTTNFACLGASSLCAGVNGAGTCKVCYTSGSCDVCDVTDIRTVTGNVGTCTVATTGCSTGGTSCAYCKDSTTCSKCVDLKTGTACADTPSLSTCTGPPTGCKHCATTTCTDCLLGYKFKDGSCTPCAVAHCDVCETSTTICDKCASTYNLYNGGTVCKSGCDPNCATPDCTTHGTGTCDTYCVKGFAISKDTTVPATLYKCQPCSAGCSSCLIKGPGKCDDQQCAAGFSLTADFKCTK